MAIRFSMLLLALVFVFLSLHSTFSSDSPRQAPSSIASPGPAHHSAAPNVSPSSDEPSKSRESPSSSPTPTPAESPESTPSPASPSPAAADEVSGHSGEKESSGGKKAGIAIGVLLGVGVVGFGGFVYKKRRDNERRAMYGQVARRGMY